MRCRRGRVVERRQFVYLQQKRIQFRPGALSFFGCTHDEQVLRWVERRHDCGDSRTGDGRQRLQDPADFVRIEIDSALKRNIPVIPLLVSGAKMPMRMPPISSSTQPSSRLNTK